MFEYVDKAHTFEFMPRYFLEISYNGGNFHGWQRQKNAMTVQERIEEVLSTIIRADVVVVGQGRTDTGVHASQFFLHFDIPSAPLPETPLALRTEKTSAQQEHLDSASIVSNLVFKANTMLGRDIAILDLYRVSDDAHARFDAKSRSYEYKVHHIKDPFLNGLSMYLSQEVDLDEMQKAASLLFGISNFKSFSKIGGSNKSDICKIEEAYFEPLQNGFVFKITADRFLRNMVRAIMGTLLDIGKGKMPAEGIIAVAKDKNRSSAGFSVPAHGLYLRKVVYPYQLKPVQN